MFETANRLQKETMRR